jgi:hypothetical protein
MNKQMDISLSIILFIVFLILKLINVIDWSWWWITSPLWIGAILAVIALIIFLITANKLFK